jgi:Ni/Co efflux regulator RcnB
MKTFLFSLAAASTVLAVPVAASAQDYRHNDNRGRIEQRHEQHVQAQRYRDFRRGERFEARYARNYQVIGNPRAYRLHTAPRGQHWVRSGNSALLVGLASGIVAAVIANAF